MTRDVKEDKLYDQTYRGSASRGLQSPFLPVPLTGAHRFLLIITRDFSPGSSAAWGHPCPCGLGRQRRRWLRPGRYGKIALHYSYQHLSPLAPYPFSLSAVTTPPTFKEHLFGLYWRWQRKSTWLPGLTPTLYTNLRHGREAEDTPGNYWQAEAQADWLFEPAGRFKSSLRLNAAQIWKAPSLTHLYSAFGTRSNPMALESRHSMATMRPNEFAATRFFQAFLRQSITLHSNKQSCFQPVLTISTSALWGTLHSDWKTLAKSVEKGYFESGLYFEDLFRMASIGYGLAVHYRYGPYQMDRSIDNWSFRLGLNFHL